MDQMKALQLEQAELVAWMLLLMDGVLKKPVLLFVVVKKSKGWSLLCGIPRAFALNWGTGELWS